MDNNIQAPLANEPNTTGNTASPVQTYTNSVVFCFIGILIFIGCVLFGMWFYRLYTTRGFHLTDFHRLSAEARSLAQETSIVRRDVEGDCSSDLSVKIANMEKMNAAEDIDNGLRVALSAWEDIMQSDEGFALDEEAGAAGGKIDRKEGRRLRERRKTHGRYVIGLMRRKCMEGVEKRKELSRGLQDMHLEVLSRKIDTPSSRVSHRMASGSSKHSVPRKALPERFRSLTHAQPSSNFPTDEKVCEPSSPSPSPSSSRRQHFSDPTATSTIPASSPQRSKDDERFEPLGPVQKE